MKLATIKHPLDFRPRFQICNAHSLAVIDYADTAENAARIKAEIERGDFDDNPRLCTIVDLECDL